MFSTFSTIINIPNFLILQITLKYSEGILFALTSIIMVTLTVLHYLTGYFDVGIAPTAQSINFTTLFVISDKYVHAQDYQENYTAVVVSIDLDTNNLGSSK